MSKLTACKSWSALAAHRKTLDDFHLRQAFETDGERFRRLSFRQGDLLVDFSKNLVTEETIALLLDLARERGLPQAIEDMFTGEKVNLTEQRAVLHVALRDRREQSTTVDGEAIGPEIAEVKERFLTFAEDLRGGAFRGHRGDAITDVVNIGIGGSDLGPVMVTEALRPLADGPRVHFVSNIDGADLHQTLSGLTPATTLFLVASKTFTTQETLTNARSARRWLLDDLMDDAAIARHFAASRPTRTRSASSASIRRTCSASGTGSAGATRCGRRSECPSRSHPRPMDHFEELLAGRGTTSTQHFRTAADLAENLPVVQGPPRHAGTQNFFDAESSRRSALRSVPASLRRLLPAGRHGEQRQGRRRATASASTDYSTGPIIWGEPGTNGQHAFYQLIHQGTPPDSCRLSRPRSRVPRTRSGDHHRILLANFFAQTEALMRGKTDGGSVRTELSSAQADSRPASVA